MTEHRTLNTVIHAAFRRDLQRFDDALDRFDGGSRARADQLSAAWDHFSYQLHRHHQDEESFFWPAFAQLGVDTTVVDDLQGEHDAMVRALHAADAAMKAFGADPSATNAGTARHAVVELHLVLDGHLAHEERDMEPFSATHKSTKQHKAAEAAARKAHTEGAGTFFSWLGDGCNVETARAIRREVPAPVLFVMTRLGGRRYRNIAQAWA
ncbi:MAG TPA: hemerythrin domain-containing protein [Acidimicrobiales bacterium]|nr:hemerythrin domain-containing protein [Acidimicrobiales bacterium]